MRYFDAPHMHSNLTKSFRLDVRRRPFLESIFYYLGFFLFLGIFLKCLALIVRDRHQELQTQVLIQDFSVTLIVALVSWLLAWALFLAPDARRNFSWTIVFSLIALAFLRHF